MSLTDEEIAFNGKVLDYSLGGVIALCLGGMVLMPCVGIISDYSHRKERQHVQPSFTHVFSHACPDPLQETGSYRLRLGGLELSCAVDCKELRNGGELPGLFCYQKQENLETPQ